jgi:hypothetical protein
VRLHHPPVAVAEKFGMVPMAHGVHETGAEDFGDPCVAGAAAAIRFA